MNRDRQSAVRAFRDPSSLAVTVLADVSAQLGPVETSGWYPTEGHSVYGERATIWFRGAMASRAA